MDTPSDELLSAARATIARASERLSTALRAVILLPGWSPNIRTATDLKKAVGTSHRISWQLHRVATTEDPLSEVRNMPRKAALEMLCTRAEGIGCAAELLVEVREAFGEFEDTVARIAGDRETLAEMVSGWSGKPRSDAALQHLRQAHRANRQVWGISAKLSFMTYIALPAPHEWIMLRGFCALRSSRRGNWDVFVNAGHGVKGGSPIGLEEGDGSGVIKSYCRGPIPQLKQRMDGERQVVTAAFDVSGEVTPHTLVFGQRFPAVDSTAIHGRLHGGFPVERRVVDLVAHHSLRPRLERDRVSWPSGGKFAPMGFIPHEVQEHSDASVIPSLRELSSYRSLLSEALGRAGFGLEEFSLFRATGAFLPVGSVLEVKLALSQDGDKS